MIKKLLLGLALTSGLMMANTTSTDDLLSIATMGKTTGSALEMSKTDMEKADGGWYIRGYWQNRINTISRYLNPKPKPKYKPRMSFADKYYSSLNRNSYYNRVGSNFRR